MKINEIEEPTFNPTEWGEYILDKCQPFLESISYEVKKYSLFRGVKREFDAQVVNVRQDRQPLTTSRKMHDALDLAFYKNDFRANRSNSLFCTHSHADAKFYGGGYAYYVFPIGNFDFAWSPKIKDLFAQMPYYVKSIHTPEEYQEILNEFIKEHYRSDNLKEAILSGNEIMMAAQKVVLVNFNVAYNVIEYLENA